MWIIWFRFIGLRLNKTTSNYTWVHPLHTYPYVTWKPDGSHLPTIDPPGDCVYIDFSRDSVTTWQVKRCTDTLPYICRKRAGKSNKIHRYTKKIQEPACAIFIPAWGQGPETLYRRPIQILMSIAPSWGRSDALHFFRKSCCLSDMLNYSWEP